MAWGKEPGTVDSPEEWESELGTVALLGDWARGHGIVDLQVDTSFVCAKDFVHLFEGGMGR